MEDLWAHGASTVGDALARLNEMGRKLAYNTVMSVMSRLAEKGYLSRRREGRAFVYEPTHDREGFIRERAASEARQLVDDFGEAAVAGFVDSVRADPSLLDELERLLRDDA